MLHGLGSSLGEDNSHGEQSSIAQEGSPQLSRVDHQLLSLASKTSVTPSPPSLFSLSYSNYSPQSRHWGCPFWSCWHHNGLDEPGMACLRRGIMSWFCIGRFKFVYHFRLTISFPMPRIMCPCLTWSWPCSVYTQTALLFAQPCIPSMSFLLYQLWSILCWVWSPLYLLMATLVLTVCLLYLMGSTSLYLRTMNLGA